MNNLLVDTCAFLWLARKDAMKEEALTLIRDNWEAGGQIFVSPITAWEIAVLYEKGRIPSSIMPEDWIEEFMQLSQFQWAQLDWRLLIASTNLPHFPNRDPADRIIVTTARENDCILLTRDQSMLDYSSLGYVKTCEC